MTMQPYVQLIENTIAYIQDLAPKKARSPLPAPLQPKPTPPKRAETEKPAPPPPKKIERKTETPLELHPPPRPEVAPSDKMGSLLKSIAPDLYIHEMPLSDEKAQRIKSAWNDKSQIPDIPILLQGSHYRPFLDNLAKAISLSFAPARVIDVGPFEKEKKWDIFLQSPQLKCILCPDHLIFSSKELLPFYKENPGQKTRFLGKIPLLLLPDLSLYFKDPYLKRFLWNVICQVLS